MDIPLEGRITAIADSFDALTTQRVYKPAFAVNHVVDLMRQQRGAHFDPGLLDVFFDSMEEVLRIQKEYPDELGAAAVTFNESPI
jgi:putative two-component system response regulator